MKRWIRPLITISLGLTLALFSAALTYSAPPDGQGDSSSPFLQVTATPSPQDLSEIGSTDGIIVMGIVIVLIIVIPILLQRKLWAESP